MAYALIAHDAPDPNRRLAVRERHLTVITRWAAEGRLALGVPLFDAAWRPMGSLMLLAVPDQAEVEAYLAEEPFAREGVWASWEIHPFRIAPLPYRPLPQPGEPMATVRTHTVVIARDGSDAAAPARRAALREAHLARAEEAARAGVIAVGGAICDAGGVMRGSIVVLRYATDAAAKAWLAEDPYVSGGVWQEVALYGTRFAPLPYRPLPGAAAAAQ